MKNNFTPRTRDLFDMGGYCYSWETGKNNADCLHHILGRCSNSPYNAAPLNNIDDHQPEGRRALPAIHSFLVEKKYLLSTMSYLESIGYVPTKKDLEFIKYNSKYYQDVKIC